MALEKTQYKAAFGKIVSAIENTTIMGSNAAKQLLQVRATFAIDDSEPELINWNLILDEATRNARKKDSDAESVSHARLLRFVASTGHETYGKQILAYLIALLGNDMSKRTLLTVHVLNEVCSELDITYDQLVDHVGVSSEGRAMSQAFFEGMTQAAQEIAKVYEGESYTCLRDIFSKEKAEEKAILEIDLGF